MPVAMDWRTSPLQLVNKVFQSRNEHSQPWEGRLREQFTALINSDTSRVIPSLNTTPNHELSDGQLVRFRAMVQDMFDPEIYLAQYETRNLATGEIKLQSGRYRDLLQSGQREEVIEDGEKNVMEDRLVLYCVSIPAEAPWVTDLYNSTTEVKAGPSGTSYNPLKRGLDQNTEDNGMDMDGMEDSNQHNTEGKRSRPETTERLDNGIHHQTQLNHLGNGNLPPAGTTPAKAFDLNLPIPNPKGKAAIVKMYDVPDGDLKLTDMIEMYGVVSLDPSLAVAEGHEDMGQSLPPPSLVPRIHVVHYTKLSNNNPLGRETLLNTDIAQLRQKLVYILTEALLGDALAAEYLLCHLLSKVYCRRDVTVLGKMSLNLIGVRNTNNWTKRLTTILQLLTTSCHYLPLSRPGLETTNFAPHKDFEANRLVSGILQLPSGTHLIIDETAMTDGQLNARGVQNLTHLGNLITWQKVDYDFKYHKLEYETDIPCLIFSEGRSMLPADFSLLVKPETDNLAAIVDNKFRNIGTLLTGDLLTSLRAYITLCRETDYSLTDTVQKAVQDDFVRMRQESGGGMTADDLHAHLVLARMVSLSHGHTTLDESQWTLVKRMEEERRRTRVVPPRQTANLGNGLPVTLNSA